jgi:transposase-like protein
MEIIRTNINEQPVLAKRRYYRAEFKASVVRQTQMPASSVAGVALQHGINPVTVHRWIREAQQFGSTTCHPDPIAPLAPLASFIPLGITQDSQVMAQPRDDQRNIRIELGTQDKTVSVHWPMSATHELAVWLREWLR